MQSLRESATLEPGAASKKRKIRLLSEGAGSSGFYSGEVLERDGATAFPAGTHVYIDHLTEDEKYLRQGNHSAKDLVGVLSEAAMYDAVSRDLTSSVEFLPHAVDFVESVYEHVGLSIEAKGAVVDGIVQNIAYSPLNAVAIVPHGGRDGKILELIESYVERDTMGHTDTTRKDKGMTPEEIAELTEALVKSLEPMFTSLQESLTPAAPAETAEDEDTSVDATVIAEALVVSGLSAAGRKRVYDGVKADATADVTALIESEKAYRDEVAQSLQESSAGRITVQEETSLDSFIVNSWK